VLLSKQEYVLWNVQSVPLLQFARYCSTVETLSLKYIPVATLTLRLHDVIGHIISYLQFPIRALLELTQI